MQAPTHALPCLNLRDDIQTALFGALRSPKTPASSAKLLPLRTTAATNTVLYPDCHYKAHSSHCLSRSGGAPAINSSPLVSRRLQIILHARLLERASPHCISRGVNYSTPHVPERALASTSASILTSLSLCLLWLPLSFNYSFCLQTVNQLALLRDSSPGQGRAREEEKFAFAWAFFSLCTAPKTWVLHTVHNSRLSARILDLVQTQVRSYGTFASNTCHLSLPLALSILLGAA